jgi:energy-coupling factor transporter ATP-binding protein EcfA2
MTLDIEVAGLRLRYGGVTALDDLSLTLGGGRIYGLLGRNGAGKTSLLSVLAGFRRPSGGTVRIDGRPVFENPRITRQVCLIRETGDTGDRDDRVRYALWTAARLRPGWDADYAGALVDRFRIPLTFAINLRVTITESVWDPAVSVVRWFAFGYGLYLLNHLLPLYVAAGRTRREFLGSVARFVAGAGAVLAALLALGFALEGVLLPGHAAGLDDHRAAPGRRVLPVRRERAGGGPAGPDHGAGDRFRDRLQRPALRRRRRRRGVADVPLAGTLALCLAGLLPGAAATWTLVRDLPIRNP